MRINQKDNVYSVRFESLADLLAHEPTLEANKKALYNLRYQWSRRFIGTSVAGAAGAAEVINNAVYGSDKLLNELEKRRKLLKRHDTTAQFEFSTITKRKRKRVKRGQGDELDIHAVYQGQLDRAWSTREHVEIETNANLYTVFIDVGGLANVDFNDSLWRGVAAYKITDDLIKAGKSVRVVVGAAAKGVIVGSHNAIVTTDIIVKNYNEPLSMERLAAMSNIGFHRVFNFKARCFCESRISTLFGFTNDYLRNSGPIEDTGVKQDVSKYIYIDRSTSLHNAVNNLERIYKKIK